MFNLLPSSEEWLWVCPLRRHWLVKKYDTFVRLQWFLWYGYKKPEVPWNLHQKDFQEWTFSVNVFKFNDSLAKRQGKATKYRWKVDRWRSTTDQGGPKSRRPWKEIRFLNKKLRWGVELIWMHGWEKTINLKSSFPKSWKERERERERERENEKERINVEEPF